MLTNGLSLLIGVARAGYLSKQTTRGRNPGTGCVLEGVLVEVLAAAKNGLARVLETTLAQAGVESVILTEPEAAISRLRAAARRSDMVVLLDFEMPGLSGTRAVHLARTLVGNRPLGILTDLAAPGMARRAWAAGASGILPADLGPDALRAALALLSAGQRFVIVSDTMETIPLHPAAALTDRELQVLHGLCDGLQNKEIAHRFGIREVTVKMHVRAIGRKLGARNRTHAAMIARDREIV